MVEEKDAATTSIVTMLRLHGYKWRRLQQGCDCNRRKTRQRCTRLLRRRTQKIVAGSFLPQGSLLAVIKEDGNKRSLLAALGSGRCGPRGSLIRSYRLGPGDKELSLEDKADLKKVGLLRPWLR
ncbi:hypothetical protein B296_00033322 [Ensete ventricosum]|uniref:Uncharacterized protein n=1 Tax=Ensete ventricosum TaxID=4639 RepID=A0A426XE32_ENSVE|nr:hypothetical protein B296_00033322 [Ensete ventricosum]